MLMEIKELHRSSKSVVTLVIDPDTGARYVRKELREPHPDWLIQDRSILIPVFEGSRIVCITHARRVFYKAVILVG